MSPQVKHTSVIAVVAGLVIGLGAATPACNLATESKPGALGHGSFDYHCVDHTDPLCPSSLDVNGEFPAAIALGAHFDLTYSPDTNQPSGSVVQPVSPDYLVFDGLSFAAVRAGTPSVVAKLPDGRVLDFTTINVLAIPRIDVADTTSGPSADVAGTTHTFTATAMAQFGAQTLAGAVAYAWTTSDPTILALASNAPAPTMQVQFLKAGSATLIATSGATQGTVNLNVVGP